MLRDETLTIGKMLEKVMMQKYGPADLKNHYMVLDTICDATQACPPPLARRKTFMQPFSASCQR